MMFSDEASPAVAFVVTSLDLGGAEAQVVALARSFRTRGWRVAVVSLLPPMAYVEELELAGVAVHSLAMRRGVPDPRALYRLVRILRRFGPDVVHAHMVHANLLARLAHPFLNRAAVISTAHNIDEGGRHRELAYRMTDRLTDITTNVSRAGVRRYVERRAAPGRRILHVPNGIDPALYNGKDGSRARSRAALAIGSRFAWLAVGRFDEQKDYPNLLRAFASATSGQQEAGTVLLIAGDGPLRAPVESLARELGVADSCRFLGRRSDVPGLLRAVDAFVLASAWEGLPMVLLEAAASELPIVATDVGGNAEIVSSGESGILVPPADPAALARAMRELMAMPQAARQRMGICGRLIVERNFAIDAVVDRWESLYRQLRGGKVPDTDPRLPVYEERV